MFGKAQLRTYLAAGTFVAVLGAAIGAWLWWSEHQFDQPGDHWRAKALHEARVWATDAKLVTLRGNYVQPDGVAALDHEGDNGWRFFFRSAALGDAEASAPVRRVPGAPPTATRSRYACFRYAVDRGTGRGGNLVRALGEPVRCGALPGSGPTHMPRCAIQQVWQKAERRGAPNPGYAQIEAKVEDGVWGWVFRIPDHAEFEFPDDC